MPTRVLPANMMEMMLTPRRQNRSGVDILNQKKFHMPTAYTILFLLLILVVLVICLGYFKLIFEPIQDQVAQYQDTTSQEQSELEQDLILLMRKQEMQRKIEEVRASGEERTIPQYDNSRRLMLDLHRILDSAVDYSLDFSQSTTQDSYIVLRPVTMSFQTHTYAQARAIVDALSESENMNQISDLSIRTNQGRDRDLVQTDLVITYFEVAS